MLTLTGPVPSSAEFDLYFAPPHSGQTGFNICSRDLNPCRATTFRRSFAGIAPSGVAPYNFSTYFGGQAHIFQSGTIALDRSNTIAATYAYAA